MRSRLKVLVEHARALAHCDAQQKDAPCQDAARLKWVRENLDWDLHEAIILVNAPRGAAEPAQRMVGATGMEDLDLAKSDRYIFMGISGIGIRLAMEPVEIRPTNARELGEVRDKLDQDPPAVYSAELKERLHPILQRGRAIRQFYTVRSNGSTVVVGIEDAPNGMLVPIAL